jgi:hypothetical protein
LAGGQGCLAARKAGRIFDADILDLNADNWVGPSPSLDHLAVCNTDIRSALYEARGRGSGLAKEFGIGWRRTGVGCRRHQANRGRPAAQRK